MKRLFFSALSLLFTLLPVLAERSWHGTLQVTPQVKMRIVLNLSDATPPVVTLDSPDQGAYGIECELRHISNDSISVAVPSLMVTYDGHITNSGIDGTFRQGGLSLPLSLISGKEELRRPQNPQPPFPYSEEEVSIVNDSAPGVTLAGTLTVPQNVSSATPLVVMVTGSGLQNRDEELMGHRPFAVIADYLARNGVASLRYDDRGFGASTGNPSTATTADNAADARAVIDYARKLNRFGKVGILGHSEGGQVAFILGAQSVPDFIVAIGAPAIGGDSILVDQNKRTLRLSGIPDEITERYVTALGRVLEAVKTDGVQTVSSAAAEACADWPAIPPYTPMRAQLDRLGNDINPWMQHFISYSPAADIAATKCPVLVIYGSKDIQVNPEVNAEPMRKLSGEKNVRVFDGLNHLMQHATTGAVQEYGEIEETIAPEVLEYITAFIRQ